jgi:diacylglycerol kinase (ATP)
MRDVLGLRRIILATRYSAQGLIAAVKGEAAFRQELALAIVLVPLGIWLGDDGTQRALLAGSVLIVLMVELLNSAVESAVDRISEERHPLAKRAKDLGSAAVMLSLAAAALVWLLILL